MTKRARKSAAQGAGSHAGGSKPSPTRMGGSHAGGSKPSPARTPETDARFPRLRLVLTVLLLLQALAAFLPGPWLWGINHLAYAPLALRLMVPALGLAVLWSPAAVALGRWMTRSLAPALPGNRWVAYVLAPLAGGVCFWVCRTSVPYLGDGWFLGELVAKGHAFHGFDWLAYYLHAKLFQVLSLQGEGHAFRLFAVVSVIAGVLYLVVIAWGARRLGRDASERVLLYALLLVFAPIQMLFGYVECYGLLLVAMTLFLLRLAVAYREGGSLFAPAVALGAGLFFHLNALFLSPVLLLAVFRPPADAARPGWRRLCDVGLPLLIAVGLAVGVHLLEGYNWAWFEHDFIQKREGRTLLMPLIGEPGLVSVTHIKDLVNLLLLLAPVALAMLAVGARRNSAPGPSGDGTASRAEHADCSEARLTHILLFGSAWIVLLMLTLDMVLGMPRDWDLLAAQAPVFVIAAYVVWTGRGRSGVDPGSLGAIAVVAGLLVLPWIWLNTDATRSLTRFGDVLDGQSAYAQAYGHEEIGKYHRKRGEDALAIAEYRRVIELFPTNPRFHALLAALLYNTGDKAGAFEAFRRTLEADPEYPLALEMMARLHAEGGEPDSAIGYARKLAGHPKESADAAELHGIVAERLDEPQEAIEAYKRAFMKDNRRIGVLERIGALGFFTGDLTSSEQAFRLVLERRPGDPAARQGLVLAIWGAVRGDPEQIHSPETRRRLEEALGLIEELEREGRADEMLLQWRREIGAALAEHPQR